MGLRLRLEHIRYPHMGAHAGYFQFARHLDRHRFDVDLRGTPDSDEELPPWLKPFRSALQRRIIGRSTPWYKVSNVGAELQALAAVAAGQVDIVHFLDGEHSSALVPKAVRRLRLSGTKTVATFHQPPSIAQDVVDPAMLRWFDRIVLVSPSQLSYFEQYVPRHKLHVLLHGVDADFFRPAPAANGGTRIRCITVGHWLRDFEAFKGVAAALEAEADITFDVVTNRSLGLENLPNVRVHKNIDDDTLAQLYRAADVLFMPLEDSTANNALLEGIASGLAVVTTDMQSTRAYLPNGEAEFVVGNDREKLLDALRRLRFDVAYRLELGRRARRRAEELAWPNIARDYGTFYDALVEEAPARARAWPRALRSAKGVEQ